MRIDFTSHSCGASGRSGAFSGAMGAGFFSASLRGVGSVGGAAAFLCGQSLHLQSAHLHSGPQSHFFGCVGWAG